MAVFVDDMVSKLPDGSCVYGSAFVNEKNRLSTDLLTFKQILAVHKKKYATFTTSIAH